MDKKEWDDPWEIVNNAALIHDWHLPDDFIDIYKEVFAGSIIARLNGSWNGVGEWHGWDISRPSTLLGCRLLAAVRL